MKGPAGLVHEAVTAERHAYRALWLFARRRRDGVADDVRGFGYMSGGYALPAVLVVSGVVEAVAVHVLLPWPAAKAVALFLTLVSLVSVAGWVAGRVVHPHLVGPDDVVLRSGRHVVTIVRTADIVRVTRGRRYSPTEATLTADGDLILPGPDGSNVRITLADPVPVRLPRLIGGAVEGEASVFALHVDDPDAFVAALERRS